MRYVSFLFLFLSGVSAGSMFGKEEGLIRNQIQRNVRKIVQNLKSDLEHHDRKLLTMAKETIGEGRKLFGFCDFILCQYSTCEACLGADSSNIWGLGYCMPSTMGFQMSGISGVQWTGDSSVCNEPAVANTWSCDNGSGDSVEDAVCIQNFDGTNDHDEFVITRTTFSVMPGPSTIDSDGNMDPMAFMNVYNSVDLHFTYFGLHRYLALLFYSLLADLCSPSYPSATERLLSTVTSFLLLLLHHHHHLSLSLSLSHHFIRYRVLIRSVATILLPEANSTDPRLRIKQLVITASLRAGMRAVTFV